MTNETDVKWMRRALEVASGAERLSPPNPAVGALIVRDDRLLAQGFTQRAGGPHAEVMALRDAFEKGVDTEGATLYVTLEPCSHYGRTPPCALAVREARFARVVIGSRDPNPLVSGRGIRILEEAGIRVDGPVLEEEAFWKNRGFMTRMRTGLPWVRLKTAATLDGRTAFPDGRSQWITGPAAREDNFHARGRAGAVVTGVGTVLADDPQMTPRLPDQVRMPLRVVLDSNPRTPPEAKLFQVPGDVLIVTLSKDAERRAALEAAGAEVIELPGSGGSIDLRALLEELARRDVNEVHVEAGARLSGAFLEAGLVDEILLYQAPCLFGEGLPIATLPLPAAPGEAPRWTIVSTDQVGHDLRIVLKRGQ